MFEKSNAKLVSNSRANLSNTNLGRRTIDDVRNDMKKVKNFNNSSINNSTGNNNQINNNPQGKITALKNLNRINKNGN